MNITTTQLHALRRLLTQEERKRIAEHVDMSVRTVEAVLNGERSNDEIERDVVKEARQKVAKIMRVIVAIDLQNVLPVSVEELKAYRESLAWQSDDFYPRYCETYIRLCGQKWETAELWEVMKKGYKDVLTRGVYCCDLLVRLIGITDNESICYYNDHIN